MLEHVSTRTRVFWLVLASALPLMLLSVYAAVQQRGAAETRARSELQHHAQLIAAMLDVSRVENLPRLRASALGAHERVLVLRRSSVIGRYPPASAALESGDAAIATDIAISTGEVVERDDTLGVPRLYASANAGAAMTVVVSVPRAAVYEHINRALIETLLGIAAVTIALIVFAWYGAERLVLRPIRQLLDTTARVRAGDLAARTGMKQHSDELSQLGSAFDAMTEQLQARDLRLQNILEELRTQAMTDGLTGLYNRRYFWDAVARELVSMRRKRATFSVILMDLDHFKRVNDTWGHDAGDVVLKEVADLLRRTIRGSDVAVRYGGEEFALLLPDTTAAVAAERAELMRRELEDRVLRYGAHAITITASFGIAECGDGKTDPAELMKRVDAALYQAKKGRNVVVVHQALRLVPPIPTHASA